MAQERERVISDGYHGPVLNQFILHDIPVTNPAVLNMSLQPDQKMFAAWTLDQLVYLLNSQYTDIENIYLGGGAFEHCFKDRPIGLNSLMDAMDLNLFDNVQRLLIPPKCVYTANGKSLSDELELIDPAWHYYNQTQDYDIALEVLNLICVKNRLLREPTTSKDVLAAVDKQEALTRTRLKTKKRELKLCQPRKQ